jgi:transcriptional regulator with XRE-family HTH domain
VSTDFQQARNTLGARLRELRTEAGLTGRQLAGRLGWLPSKVSKLENGKQTPSLADLEAWARGVGSPESAAELKGRLRGFETRYRSWRRQLASGHRARQEAGIVELAQTRVMRGAEFGVVPGIFQTAECARAVLTRYVELSGTPRGSRPSRFLWMGARLAGGTTAVRRRFIRTRGPAVGRGGGLAGSSCQMPDQAPGRSSQ